MIQHEIVVYAANKEVAKTTVLRAYTAKTKCISIEELPPVEEEALGHTVIDNRKTPGA